MVFRMFNKKNKKIIYNSDKENCRLNNNENKVKYSHKILSGWLNEIRQENYRITYGDSKINKPTNLLFELEGETVEMHFTLKGNTKGHLNDYNLEFEYRNNTHNIFYCNNINGEIELNAENICFLKINIEPNFFKKYLPNEDLFLEFKEILNKKKAGFLGHYNFPITSDMMSKVQDIINYDWTNKYRSLFFDSKILELLLLQLNQIATYEINLCNQPNSSKELISKMIHVKKIILDRLDQNLLISDLAKIIFTNEFTLKKEFKKQYGSTINGYIFDAKMNKAKELLIKNNLTIREVSELIGYKNPQHFSTAFKRKYGFSPSKLKCLI
ncbi:MAG: helix-turn-helix transcriptional regulator [Flavobacteriaceae bacterium]|nr:helix-turn-helix transcriptional regulator [Flavobacteriaceae bacterium]